MQDIGKRIKFARECAGLTQAEVAARFGFKDRQTLVALESGKRKLLAGELLKACQIFEKPLEFFTDPFHLFEEGRFTWHAKSPLTKTALNALNEKVGSYLALYRTLKTDTTSSSVLEPRLILECEGDASQVIRAARALSKEWALNPVPADRVECAILKHLPFMVFDLDLPAGVYSGSCRLNALSSIFLSRALSYKERALELTRQCFILLTAEQLKASPLWTSAMSAKGKGAAKHAERLTRQFLYELLIPEARAKEFLERCGKNVFQTIQATTVILQVPARFVLERFEDLGEVTAKTRAAVLRIKEEHVAAQRKAFNESFIREVHRGIATGRISQKVVARLLELDCEKLEDLFESYSLDTRVLMTF